MQVSQVTFPLFKLRSYLSMDKNPLGVIRITTIKGVYVLDDLSIQGTFSERRTKLPLFYPKEKVYKLKEQVIYLRQLVKYKSNTTFIDYNGSIIRYKKSSKMFEINSHKILRKKDVMDNWTVLYLDNIEQPFLIGQKLTIETKFASIMDTKWGPFLYDITSIRHPTYKRKI